MKCSLLDSNRGWPRKSPRVTVRNREEVLRIVETCAGDEKHRSCGEQLSSLAWSWFVAHRHHPRATIVNRNGSLLGLAMAQVSQPAMSQRMMKNATTMGPRPSEGT